MFILGVNVYSQQSIIVLTEDVKQKFGLYSGIDAVDLPDGTYMISERCLSDNDLASAHPLIQSIQSGLTEILQLPDSGWIELGKVYQWSDVDNPERESNLFVCVQSHNRTIYKPTETPALFMFFRYDYDPWIQPTGAHDSYNIGDKVTFENVRYESLINANVWSPSVYPQGWQYKSSPLTLRVTVPPFSYLLQPVVELKDE